MPEKSPIESSKNLLNQIIEIVKNLPPESQNEVFCYLSESTESNNRKYFRKKLLMPIEYSINNRFHKDFIKDISQGGIFIETGKQLLVGQVISLTFTNPKNYKPIKTFGKIVRVEKNGIGVEFNVDKPEVAFFKGWLTGQNKHLASNFNKHASFGGYCYTNPNGYDYSNKEAFPVSVEKAFAQEWITFDKKNQTYKGHSDWEGLKLE